MKKNEKSELLNHEKTLQKKETDREKEWRKRKQGKHMPNSTNKNVELQSLNREANELVPCTSEAKETKLPPSDQHLSHKMSRNPISSRLNQAVKR